MEAGLKGTKSVKLNDDDEAAAKSEVILMAPTHPIVSKWVLPKEELKFEVSQEDSLWKRPTNKKRSFE